LKKFRIRCEVEEMLGGLEQRHRVEGGVHAGELVQRLRRLTGVGALRRVDARRPLAVVLAEVVGKAEATLLLSGARTDVSVIITFFSIHH